MTSEEMAASILIPVPQRKVASAQSVAEERGEKVAEAGIPKTRAGRQGGLTPRTISQRNKPEEESSRTDFSQVFSIARGELDSDENHNERCWEENVPGSTKNHAINCNSLLQSHQHELPPSQLCEACDCHRRTPVFAAWDSFSTGKEVVSWDRTGDGGLSHGREPFGKPAWDRGVQRTSL